MLLIKILMTLMILESILLTLKDPFQEFQMISKWN